MYILASKRNGTIYTGVTSNLVKRVYAHKQKLIEGFTKKYKIHTLVRYEVHQDMTAAIQREKQIKAGSRKKKIALIEKTSNMARLVSKYFINCFELSKWTATSPKGSSQ